MFLIPVFAFLCFLFVNTLFHSVNSLRIGGAFIKTRSISFAPKLSAPSLSTVVKPKKPTKKDIVIEPAVPGIFKEDRDFEQEFRDALDEERYMVLLYNDPFNKRQYVAQCLMEVFSWSENKAAETMMQAHTYGFAVTGEWYKELAEDYCVKLVERGLIAEVKKSESSDGSSA